MNSIRYPIMLTGFLLLAPLIYALTIFLHALGRAMAWAAERLCDGALRVQSISTRTVDWFIRYGDGVKRL